MAGRRWILALGVVALLIATMIWVDRPWAWFAFRNFHDSRGPFIVMTRLVDVLEFFATLILIGAGLLFLCAKHLGGRGIAALRVALALFVALGVKEVLKLAFGRAWPETWVGNNPSLISNDVFGFFPFHGGAGFASFPSGHETVVCAVAACLWVLVPRFRPIWAVGPIVVALGLLGADYHFVSDVLAGAVLGAALGMFCARVELPPSKA